jgi:hypothetical protein
VVVCGQRTKVKTALFPGHKVLLIREIGSRIIGICICREREMTMVTRKVIGYWFFG